MGEPLYDQVVGPVAQGKLDRPCRIYAPVGTHETLLAYLVRRLLENGANTSFVNRIADPAIGIDELIADPVAAAERLDPVGAPHPGIVLPRALYADERINSAGVDLSNEAVLAALARDLSEPATRAWTARATNSLAGDDRKLRDVLNPADGRDRVGTMEEANSSEIEAALKR